MSLKRRPAILGTLVVFAVLCVTAWTRDPQPSRAAFQHRGNVIVRIAGNGQQITVTTGHGEPRYTVERGGAVVAEGATLEQLRSLDPQSYQQIRSANAGGEDRLIADLD